MRSGTTADAVYWFKSAMARYPRQMERFFGDSYAAATRLYYAMQGTLNVADDSELPLYDAKQLLKTYKNDAILIFTDEASAVQTEGSLAAELQAQLDKQKYDEGEDPDKVCAIARSTAHGATPADFTPDDADCLGRRQPDRISGQRCAARQGYAAGAGRRGQPLPDEPPMPVKGRRCPGGRAGAKTVCTGQKQHGFAGNSAECRVKNLKLGVDKRPQACGINALNQ